MTNNELHKQLSVEVENIHQDLQQLRDSTGTETQAIINEMLTATRFLQGKCFDLSNREDIYKS